MNLSSEDPGRKFGVCFRSLSLLRGTGSLAFTLIELLVVVDHRLVSAVRFQRL